MPYWIRIAFFDPEVQRARIEIHDYKGHQTGVKAIRKMDSCRLIDELEVPLKGFENFHQVAFHINTITQCLYLANFVCPQPDDWPSQCYVRKVQLHAEESGESEYLQHIVPFIGPLHIHQLNVRESV